MGVIAVPRASVNEWVLPVPRVTSGEAFVALEGDPAASVAGFVPAEVTVTSTCFVTVTVVGLAGVEGEGDTFVFPAPVGDAALSVDGVSETALPHVTTGVAYAEALGSSDVVVAVECVAGVVVVTPAAVEVPQLGSAEVEIEYYGDGDVPIFPFNLPFLFMGIDFSNLDAAAIADVVSAADSAAAMTGEASLAFTGLGDFVFQGSTPIFPFTLPTVFGQEANVQRAFAEIEIDLSSDSLCLVVGSSEIIVDGVSESYYPAVFPTYFPFVLQQIIGSAIVVLSSANDATVVVDGSAAVDIYTVASTS